MISQYFSLPVTKVSVRVDELEVSGRLIGALSLTHRLFFWGVKKVELSKRCLMCNSRHSTNSRSVTGECIGLCNIPRNLLITPTRTVWAPSDGDGMHTPPLNKGAPVLLLRPDKTSRRARKRLKPKETLLTATPLASVRRRSLIPEEDDDAEERGRHSSALCSVMRVPLMTPTVMDRGVGRDPKVESVCVLSSGIRRNGESPSDPTDPTPGLSDIHK